MHVLFLLVLMLLTIRPAMAQEETEIPQEPETAIEAETEAESGDFQPVDSRRKSGRAFRIGAGLGYAFAGYRDEVESPINRYFNTFIFILDGNIEKGNFFHSLDVNFLKGKPQMDAPYKGYTQKQYTAIKGGLEYALDYRLWGNETLPGYLGGALRMAINYTGIYGDDVNLDIPIPTGYGMVSLDLHATQKWTINTKHLLTLSIGYPIFGYAVRPAYVGFDEMWLKYLYENPLKIVTLGHIVSFHNYWAVVGDLKYHYRYSKEFCPYAGLGFEIARINFPRPRIDALFRLNTGIAITF